MALSSYERTPEPLTRRGCPLSYEDEQALDGLLQVEARTDEADMARALLGPAWR